MTASPSALDRHARPEHGFYYAVMAVLLLALSIAGFGASYLAPLSIGASRDPSIIHLHALSGFAWLLLLCAETILISRGAASLHRALGLFGIALATAIVFTGLMVAAKTMRVGVEAGMAATAKTFAIFPVTIILLFAGFFTAAIANIARPALHKRLMLVASIMIMPPAVGRVVGRLLLEDGLPRQILGAAPASLAGGTVASLSADVLILVAIAYDWRMRGRPHPVYLYSLAIILVVQIARLPLSQTEFWRRLMDILLSI